MPDDRQLVADVERRLTEPGAAFKPIETPMVVVLVLDDADAIARRFSGLAPGLRVYEATIPRRHVDGLCQIHVRPPSGYADILAWRDLLHGLRHCNGERHTDARDGAVWLDRTAPR